MRDWWQRISRRANVAMGADLSPRTNLAIVAAGFALTAVATAAHAKPLTSLAVTAILSVPVIAAFFIAERRDVYNRQSFWGMLKYVLALTRFIIVLSILAQIGFSAA